MKVLSPYGTDKLSIRKQPWNKFSKELSMCLLLHRLLAASKQVFR